jgi:hypothetical protein
MTELLITIKENTMSVQMHFYNLTSIIDSHLKRNI